jgi:hypothetical protein
MQQAAYRGGRGRSTCLVQLYLQYHDTNQTSLTVAGINDMLRVPKVALVDASISLFSIEAAICFLSIKHYSKLENTASSCRLSLDHDENNKYLHEK